MDAFFNGNVLPFARRIENHFGAGSFKKIGEIFDGENDWKIGYSLRELESWFEEAVRYSNSAHNHSRLVDISPMITPPNSLASFVLPDTQPDMT
jgi:hypothetical protein